MALGSLVKTLQNIMRNDAGINGDAQRIEQMTWLFFLKIYDAKEEEWEFHDDSYESIIPDRLRWHSWAPDAKDGNALTGDELLDFINNDLFKTLAGLELAQNAPLRQVVVKAAFTDANNYMKDGILLRQVVNAIDDAVDFTEYKERHAFGEIYETILKDLQSAGNAGEFYTPRAVTDFMAEMLNPKLGESVADFACGTGGFLTSALNLLARQVKTPADQELYSKSIYGIEKKQLPYLLCITNMLLHDIDNPQVFHDNSLEHDVRDYRHKEDGQFDVVLIIPHMAAPRKLQSKITSLQPCEAPKLPTCSWRLSYTASKRMAAQRSSSLMVFCSVKTRRKSKSSVVSLMSLICIPSYACRKVFLRPTRASPPTSFSSTIRRNQRGCGSTVWTCPRAISISLRPSQSSPNISTTSVTGGRIARK